MGDELTTNQVREVVTMLRRGVGWSATFRPMPCNPEMVNDVLAIWGDWCAAPPQTADERERAWKCGEMLAAIRHEDGSMLALPPLVLP